MKSNQTIYLMIPIDAENLSKSILNGYKFNIMNNENNEFNSFDREFHLPKDGLRNNNNLHTNKGRKTIITDKLIEEVQNLKDKQQLPIIQIAKVLKISRSTVYKI